MRLATITNWAYGMTVVLALASGTAMLLASAAQDRERAAVAQRFDLDRATATVAEDVAVLSRLARQFAISGNLADLTAYRREAGLLRAVEERTRHIRDAGAGIDELRALHEALRWADSLSDEQQVAIEARRRGDGNGAMAILFSPEYERELDRIQISVERFRDRIDQRTDTAVQAAIRTSKLWRAVSESVLAITGLLFLGVLYFVFRRRVLRPVMRLSDVVTRLAAQDYDVEPPQYDQIDEIGDMAQALRVFRENGIVRQRLEQERDADRAMRDLLSRMTQRMQSCATTEEMKSVVERFVPEIAPQLAGRLYLLDAARNMMVGACSWLDPAHSRTEFAPTACWALRRGSAHRAAGERIDVACDHVCPENGIPLDSICLPLAGQHGTLGLLYFERQPDVPMREVPEVYLTILAENVGLALDNLQLRDALHDLAMIDPLTMLANRRELETVLKIQLAQSERMQTPISCAMIDIDHFKRFNDEYGHGAGDAVLRAVGETLKQSVREGHLAFRYGGEEFLLLMPGLEPVEAEARAEEIRMRIAALRVRHEERDLGQVTASLGVASAPAQCPRERLVQAADAALRRAKRDGRNQVAAAQARKLEPSHPR